MVTRTGSRLGASRRAQDGYNMVVLVMAITVLNIMVAASLPVWSHITQRDREEELIFRGLQYAEGIRVFQQRYHRLPVRLEELIEVDQRCIRQLWDNPMSEDGSWGLVFARTPQRGRGGGRDENARRRRLGREDDRGAADEETTTGQPALDPSGRGKQQTTGPIRGVYSTVGGPAIRTFTGRTDFGQWQFVIEHVAGLQLKRGETNLSRPVNASDIGKPWPPGISVQPVGVANPAAGQDVGGRAGRDRRDLRNAGPFARGGNDDG